MKKSTETFDPKSPKVTESSPYSKMEDLRALFQATPNPYLILKPDAQFTIVDVNEAYLKATMNSRESLIGKGMFTAFPENPSESKGTGVKNLRASFQKVLETAQTDVMRVQKYDIPKPTEKGDGFEERYWIPTNTPVLDKEGKLLFIIHHVNDVTDFKLQQQKQQQQQDQQKLAEQHAVRSTQRRNSEIEAQIFIHTQKAKEAEEHAKEMNARYRTLTSTLPVGVFHTDLEDHCLYVNAKWEDITGIKLESLRNKTWISLLHPDDQKRFSENLKQCKKCETICSFEARILLPQKEERWVLVQLTPEKDTQTQKVKGYIGSLTDITAQKELETHEKKRAESLEELSRLKTDFFNNISHEFRTPLTLILGILDEMLTDHDQPTVSVYKERLNVIQHHALRILKLVNSLLDFARIETKRMQAQYQPTDLAKLTTELVNFFTTAFERARIELKVDIKPLDELVYVDQEMWEKIVLNLLSNALKYTHQGSVTIELKKQNHVAALSVKDTGVGIPKSDLPRLFERFYRASNAQGRSYEGAGIGLALTHELVKLHGGFAKVESEEGKGSQFTVAIPLGKSHLPASQIVENKKPMTVATSPLLSKVFSEEIYSWFPAETKTNESKVEETSPSPSGGKSPIFFSNQLGSQKKKILLADDNSDLRDFISRELKPYWDVNVVTNGAEALEAALKDSPDLVLSDVMMPKMDGFGLVSALRNDPKTKMIPIILMSARSGDEAQIEALEKGVDDYMVKPFTRKELLARVKANLELGGVRVSLDKAVKEKTERLDQEIEEHKQTANHLKSNEEEEQKRQLQQAEDHRQKMENFIDTLCHELRNPANGIYGSVNLLEMLLSQMQKIIKTDGFNLCGKAFQSSLLEMVKELQESISAIEKCVKYQKVLLDDILHVSKLESGKVHLQEVECNPRSLIQDAISMFSSDMNQKKLKAFTLLPQQEVWIKADTDRLMQILTNLLSNAIKFTPPNGQITVSLNPLIQKENETELEFKVEDTGIGMTPEEQSRLFNRFEQMGRSTSREYGGSGLGLVICKNLVTLMKGKIEIESEKLKGTKCRFTIKCPTAKPAEKPKINDTTAEEERRSSVSSPAPSPSPAPPLNILVAEDNLLNQKLLVKLLERLGHHCKVANNGKEAVDLISQVAQSTMNQIPFDVILMDIEMPIMNGLDATAEIRAKEKKITSLPHPIPIIALSGYSSADYIQKAKLAGMNDFITKPYEINKLDAKIKEWVAALKKKYSSNAHPATEEFSEPSVSICSLSSSSFFTSPISSTSSTSSSSAGDRKSEKEKVTTRPLGGTPL